MKSFVIMAGVVGLVGLGVMLGDVKTDYSHHVDFNRFHTYSWLKVQTGNPLWVDRIKRAVDQQLSAKGWTMEPSGGQVAVSAFGSTKDQQSLETFYDGLGGGWGWRGFGGEGLATTTTVNQEVGTLTIDMFDAATKQLIWRGTATKTLSNKPDQNEKKLNEQVADMFKKFPPKSKA